MAALENHFSFGSARNRLFIFVDYAVKKLSAVTVGHFYKIVKSRLKTLHLFPMLGWNVFLSYTLRTSIAICYKTVPAGWLFAILSYRIQRGSSVTFSRRAELESNNAAFHDSWVRIQKSEVLSLNSYTGCRKCNSSRSNFYLDVFVYWLECFCFFPNFLLAAFG